MAEGLITRGTTNVNRLRRCDRWIATWPGLRRVGRADVVDLGFGARAITTLELATRLGKVRDDVHVWGIEIDPERVATANRELAAVRPPVTNVSFSHGGFEIPEPRDRDPVVIRAFNVLRQYDVSEVDGAWATMLERLHPDGVLVDGTCDELGRVSTWLALTPTGPQSLSLSLRLTDLESPLIAAERLPKALIHRNVPGEGVHAFLLALDEAWRMNASLSTFGPVQRWQAAVAHVAATGWPLIGGRSRWRLGEVTVAWHAVA
ncbi:MAG: class I SAM-dependent methyltransferase [Actinobacteria bacterium]|uniref:Unannotated protein n=1 Tax=freshwater metagenome TaxID=449393 RepID=A0A6J7F9E1_9ZZZZ|nr:class I SAM-dependent methyltransferase [Actinomycetota bacterium]